MFDQLFTRAWWGWYVTGTTPATSPATVWQVSGGQYQVNRRGSWMPTMCRTLSEAKAVAVGILDES